MPHDQMAIRNGQLRFPHEGLPEKTPVSPTACVSPVVTVVADGRVYASEEFAKTMVDVEAA